MIFRNRFHTLGIRTEIIESLNKIGISSANETQKNCIPALLSKQNTILTAMTGSGKTLCYLIPMLNSLYSRSEPVQNSYSPKCLILTNSKHLQLQILLVLQSLNLSFTHSLLPLSSGLPLSKIGNIDIGISSPKQLLSIYKKNKDFEAFLENTRYFLYSD
jgi:ATP-dependent RNA helicase RhlE